MLEQRATFELFFEQLGLDSSPEAIDEFISTHQIGMDVPLHKAPFWSKSQHDFLISHWKKDDGIFLLIQKNLLTKPAGFMSKI